MYSAVNNSLTILFVSFASSIGSLFVAVIIIGVPVFFAVKFGSRVLDWFFSIVLNSRGYSVPNDPGARRYTLDSMRDRSIFVRFWKRQS